MNEPDTAIGGKTVPCVGSWGLPVNALGLGWTGKLSAAVVELAAEREGAALVECQRRAQGEDQKA